MCGINGIYAFANRPFDEAVPLIASMNRRLRHRGPDDTGVWSRESVGVWLGHQRLSIIDLSSGGHQPMEIPNGPVVTFNGEIYNYRELAQQVDSHNFRTGSDTELLLALYEKKGPAFLEDLVGMFAFAIWDPARQQLFLARDRIGKKPLYYCQQNGCFAFSSELRSLFALPWIERSLDRRALYDYLTFGFCPPPQTMFQGIQKLAPGHSLTVRRNGDITDCEYWSPTRLDLVDNEAELIDEMSRRLDRSLQLRMVSDVPIGLFLSGGVDSTGIASMVHRRRVRDVRSFSIGFQGQAAYDESDTARATAKRYNFEHVERSVGPSEISQMMGVLADVLDEPLSDPTCIPIYFLAELAKSSGTKVVLTGDGPDELLLGYQSWQKYLTLYPWFRRFQRSPASLQFGVGKCIQRFSPSLVEFVRRAGGGEEFFWGNAPSFSESEKASLLSSEFLDESKAWNSHDAIAPIRREFNRTYQNDSVDANWLSYVGLRFVIPNYYLHRADRLGMRHSVELRSPYLDHDFVNLCLSIPPARKVNGTHGKYLLKRLFEPHLPHDLLYAPKKGFCVPMREWGRGIMQEYLRDNIPAFCDETGLLNQRRVLDEVATGSMANLWNLYFLINWHENWLRS